MNLRTNELGVRDLLGVELNAKGLCVVGVSLADLAVVWVGDVVLTTGVANGSLQDAFVLSDGILLQENTLDAPEASSSECSKLRLYVYTRMVSAE